MQIVTAADRPDLESEAGAAFREKWPEFIFHDDVAAQYAPRVETYFSRLDILVLDDDGAVVAGGWGVPLAWDGTVEDLPDGYDGALVRSVDGHEEGRACTTLSFMAAAVKRSHDRRGLATVVLEELTRRAVEDGLTHVIAPLRPTWKHRYPTYSMAEYATWARERRPLGRPVDPHAPADGGPGARARPALDGDRGQRRRVGGLGRHGVPGDRRLRGPRRARAGPRRP